MKAQSALWSLVIVVLAGGCGDATPAADTVSDSTPAAQASDAVPLRCSTYYRSSVTKAPKEGPVLTFDQPWQTEAARFDDLTLRGRHFNDPYENRSLNLAVLERGREHELVNHLYQMDHNKAPANSFGKTGQGFTGLVYAYSSSGSELQFSCVAG